MSAPLQDKTVADDAALLPELKSESEAAFAELYDRFAPVLFSMLCAILGDENQAETLLEDAFLRMRKAIASYDPSRNSLFTWAVMISRQLALERLRARSHTNVSATLLRGDALELAFFSGSNLQGISEATGLSLGEVGVELRDRLLRLHAAPERDGIEERLQEQAAMYVFGLLEDSAGFERQLHSDAKLRALLDRLDEAAATLALRAPPKELPLDLRGRVLDRLRPRISSAFSRRGRWIPWVIAAGFALSCAYLISERNRLRHRIAHLEQRDLFAQVRIVTLRSPAGVVSPESAVVLWDEKRQRGVLQAEGLSPNDTEHDYELWIVDPRYKDPVSAGRFHFAPNESKRVEFQPSTPVRGAKEFEISLERKGGAAGTRGPMVLHGN